MSVQENEVLVKITSAGTISIPKQFRKFMDIQKGEYVKLILGKDRLISKKNYYFLISYCCFCPILMA